MDRKLKDCSSLIFLRSFVPWSMALVFIFLNEKIGFQNVPHADFEVSLCHSLTSLPVLSSQQVDRNVYRNAFIHQTILSIIPS
jgi:hypothetical protein